MKFIVLDFRKNITYVYTQEQAIWAETDIEELLHDLGHDSSNCQWMLTKNEIIIK